MSSSSPRIAKVDASSLLGDHPVITIFDRADPATCLTVRLSRRGRAFQAAAPARGVLLERLRFGLQPAFFCVVEGAVLEGELQVELRSAEASSPLLDVVVAHVGPVPADGATPSIPRT